jgi:hypothetical protein
MQAFALRTRLIVVVPLGVCLIHCDAGDLDKGREGDVHFLEWAQKRADRELNSFASWALERGFASPASEANFPLNQYGNDVGYECAPGKPPPDDGFCSGAHRDASGWIALMHWKLDDPQMATIAFNGYAPQPLGCAALKGTGIGRPSSEADDERWLTGMCELQKGKAIVEQLRGYNHPLYVKTRIEMYSEALIRSDTRVAALLNRARKATGAR